MYDRLRADFDLVINTPDFVLIRDNANYTQTMTVTNDAENVVKFLKDKSILYRDNRLFSICTDDTVDELLHDGNGKFLGFKFAAQNEREFYRLFT